MAQALASNLAAYQSASSLPPACPSRPPPGTSPVFASPAHLIPTPTHPRCARLQLHARPTRDDELAATFRDSRMHCHASNGSGSISTPAPAETEDVVPTPIVLIDQDSDNNATVVELSFGNRLGALLDTMKALKDLGLDVVKGNVSKEASIIRTKFFITRSNTGRKVENPELLEAIRLTIIRNLLKYHPESSERLAMGEAWGVLPPKRKLDVDIATHITITEDGPKRSLLAIETADRPGLLMEIVKIMADINVSVESAEIDTEGLVAKDRFHVNYHGAALTKSISEVLTNCLRYYLRRPETDDESY